VVLRGREPIPRKSFLKTHSQTKKQILRSLRLNTFLMAVVTLLLLKVNSRLSMAVTWIGC